MISTCCDGRHFFLHLIISNAVLMPQTSLSVHCDSISFIFDHMHAHEFGRLGAEPLPRLEELEAEGVLGSLVWDPGPK